MTLSRFFACLGIASLTLGKLHAQPVLNNNPKQTVQVFMAPQLEDLIDPCRKRYEVQPDDSCRIIAQKAGISLEQLLHVNPGFKCSELFVGINVCVDSQLSPRSDYNDAAGYFPAMADRTLNDEEFAQSLRDADTQATVDKSLDTGMKKK